MPENYQTNLLQLTNFYQYWYRHVIHYTCSLKYKDLKPVLLKNIIIKFPYNLRSDWLKQRPLSENKVQGNDIKLAFKFLLRNFDKFDPN